MIEPYKDTSKAVATIRRLKSEEVGGTGKNKKLV